ncbi:hypothetical protein UFOVP1124_45 [uncultured Caudovirales phage]|uniref:Uncharacterized protein n=1 Tax=uncultured Caudovirales phage TaxID=2100421 RepID=A0A6J5QM59_9CAUD|nr:hypothetical protein UFOVP1124_45 [uncultured Caudovirales phage]
MSDGGEWYGDPVAEHAVRFRRRCGLSRSLSLQAAGGELTTPILTEEQCREFGPLFAERMRHVIEAWRAGNSGPTPQPISSAIMGMISALDEAAGIIRVGLLTIQRPVTAQTEGGGDGGFVQ